MPARKHGEQRGGGRGQAQRRGEQPQLREAQQQAGLARPHRLHRALHGSFPGVEFYDFGAAHRFAQPRAPRVRGLRLGRLGMRAHASGARREKNKGYS